MKKGFCFVSYSHIGQIFFNGSMTVVLNLFGMKAPLGKRKLLLFAHFLIWMTIEQLFHCKDLKNTAQGQNVFKIHRFQTGSMMHLVNCA